MILILVNDKVKVKFDSKVKKVVKKKVKIGS